MSTFDTLAGPSTPPVNGSKVKREPHPIRGVREGETIHAVPYTAYSKDSDYFLSWLWRRLKAANLLELYFPGLGELSFPAMVELFSGARGIKVILILVKNAQGEVVDVLGIATWEPMQIGTVQTCYAGFIFLPEYWDRHSTVEAAKQGMRYWFYEMEPRMEVILGVNPEGNHLVQRFLHRLGWTRVGTLPIPQWYEGKPSDTVIWYITRAQFDAMEKEGK